MNGIGVERTEYGDGRPPGCRRGGPRVAHLAARLIVRLSVLACAAVLGGCLVSGSIGGGGARGGISVGVGGAGVTIHGGTGGVSVGVQTRGGRSSAQKPHRPTGEADSATLMKKPVASGRLTSRFGPRHGRSHNGVDYAAPRGTAVYAAGDGVISVVRQSASYGNLIRVDHGNDLESGYAHLASFAEGLGKGTWVRRGQIIGTVGDTGRASGSHLHYEVIHAGRFVDPLGDLFARR